MKRFNLMTWIGLSVLAALVLAVSACGGGGGSSSETPTQGGHPIDLTPEVEVHFVDSTFRNSTLSDNNLAYDPVFDFIAQAQSSLDVAAMRINRQSFVDALLAKSATVHIRIVTEKGYYDDPLYKPFYDQLSNTVANNNNIQIVTDKDGFPRQMHERYIVIDGARVLTGAYDFSAGDVDASMGDVVILKNTAIAQTFEDDFNQMFVEGNFGVFKRNEVQHTFVVGAGAGAVEVYFGPNDKPRDLVMQGIQGSGSIGFSVKQFSDVDVANTIINWANGATGERSAFMVINDIGASTSATETQIYNALLGLVQPTQAQGQTSVLRMSSINTMTFGDDTLNHKFIFMDHALDNPTSPAVMTGTPNWTAANFDLHDEDIVVLRGASLVQKYTGYLNAASFLAIMSDTANLGRVTFPVNGATAPSDVGELFANFFAFPSVTSPDIKLASHPQESMAIIYGVVEGFSPTISVNLGTTQGIQEIPIGCAIYYEGTYFFGGATIPQTAGAILDRNPSTNPDFAYAIVVPAGTIQVTAIVTDTTGAAMTGFAPDIQSTEVGPGGVRRLALHVSKTITPAGGGTGGGGTGGGTGG